MLYDDINVSTMTGTILKTEVREIKNRYVLVIRIAINKSYKMNGIIKKESTIIECQKWSKYDPKNQAIVLTKGTRISITGELKENNYYTKDGNLHRSIILSFINFFIIKKGANPDEVQEEENDDDDEDYYKRFEDEESIYDNPLF